MILEGIVLVDWIVEVHPLIEPALQLDFVLVFDVFLNFLFSISFAYDASMEEQIYFIEFQWICFVLGNFAIFYLI